ncbi:MAG: glycoside hydrolase family 16 protein [Fibrobacter sp.]|nr:glycoside hydrolase family 16 protein [Fibrobacter sp.]
MKEYKVENHVSSFLPENKNWKLVWSDEFDGNELDTSKWYYRLHMTGKKHTTYIEDAISFDGNSNIIFHLVEKDGKYYSSTIQTGENFTDKPNGEGRNTPPKFLHKYGYYEVRCKLQHERPWWTAFWLQSPTIAEELPPEKAGVEVDILESFRPGKLNPHFNHWGGYDKTHQFANTIGVDRWTTDDDAYDISLDEYHTFAVHWAKDGYTFYVDGKQSGLKINGPVSDTEQFILLFTECQGFRAIPGYKGIEKFPSGLKDKFVVDYVRVFDEV